MGVTNIFLEAKPGVGKTTLLYTLALRLSIETIGGFYTEEIREKGERVGFRLRTFDGLSEGVLAHASFTTGPRVGKYHVNVPVFEKVGVQALLAAMQSAPIILIDEIGKMELCSTKFKNVLVRCLDSPKPVIATIMADPDPFADQLKQRDDVELIQVTPANREKLVAVLYDKIQALTQAPG